MAAPPNASQPIRSSPWTQPRNLTTHYPNGFNLSAPVTKHGLSNAPAVPSCFDRYNPTSGFSNQMTAPNPPVHHPTPFRALNPAFLSSTSSAPLLTTAPEPTQQPSLHAPHPGSHVPRPRFEEPHPSIANLKRNRDAYECDESDPTAFSKLHSRPAWRRRTTSSGSPSQLNDSRNLALIAPTERDVQSLAVQQISAPNRTNPNQCSMESNRMFSHHSSQQIDPRFMRPVCVSPQFPTPVPMPTLMPQSIPVPAPPCVPHNFSAPYPFRTHNADPRLPINWPFAHYVPCAGPSGPTNGQRVARNCHCTPEFLRLSRVIMS